MSRNKRTGAMLSLGVPSGVSARIGRVPRSFERRPVHVADLSATRPQASGVVRLPLHLSWSGDNHGYDLADRRDLARLYERVLTEGTDRDIIFYVDLDLLVDVWSEMVLPAHVREAWQGTIDSHSEPTNLRRCGRLA